MDVIIAYLFLAVVVGLLVWLAIIPLPPQFKLVLPFIEIIAFVLIFLASVFGIGFGHNVSIPRLR